MEVHTKTLEQLQKEFNTNLEKGLTEAQAVTIRQKVGENRIQGKKKKTILQRFLAQFKDAMIIILLVAAGISFYIACKEGHLYEFFEPALILLIVVLNAIMGTVQESKAEKALEALQSMSVPHARVIRDGTEKIVDAALLVPGDIIFIEAGDYVPADARLLEAANLKVEESALTGESVPAEKDAQEIIEENAPLGDRKNMIYSGCSVTYGRARALIVATGMSTQVGKIAGMLNNEEDMTTPLQQKLAKLGKTLGFLAIAICIVIFLIGVTSGMEILEIFMVAVSLAVSAIPEGLPAIVTIVLSLGVTRMVKQNAIIRKLPAVETLGSASVICSDKTGTLTQNRMTLVCAMDVKKGKKETITEQNSEEIRELLKLGTLCCDGSVVLENGKEKHLGDPTETSIVAAALKNGMTKEQLNQAYKRIAELPFDSDRKLMTVVCEMDGRKLVITKGGFDTLIKRCIQADYQEAQKQVEQMSKEALRVLAIAVKEISELPKEITSQTLECDLNLIGLVGMIDPPREEAKEAVKLCRQAGIKPVMITGDHVLTASAIAKQLGILSEGDEAITGDRLARMSEQELEKHVRTTAVYARVSPEDKIRIVKAWQKQGEIVSMTGDGVNDAPALKAADIGCAMGITGTDVAKGASDMTLMDDNFATIVQAVKEGRGIYDNIRKAVAFLLGTNIGEVFTTFIAMLFWKQAPFLAMQLLWINLVTDSLPAIALGVEAVDSEVMNRKPKPRTESIFAHGLGIQIILQGILFAILTLFAFRLASTRTGSIEGGRTLAFLVLGFIQIIHAYNMRSGHSLFRIGIFTNKYLNGAFLISLILMCFVLFVPPVANIFGLTQLPIDLYFIGIGLAIIPIPVLEIVKAFGLIRFHKH